MSFLDKFNKSSFNTKKSFSVEEFNNNFTKQQQDKQQLTRQQLTKQHQQQFMDPRYNYVDPSRPNYVNPNRDSPDRAACLLVVDKHRKRFLAVWKLKGSYDIPGGHTKIIETYEDAAVRELREETGIIVEKRNMSKILEAFDGKFNVITYVAFVYKGHIQTQEQHLVGWVPFQYLTYNKNPRWQKYNQIVYNKLLGMLY